MAAGGYLSILNDAAENMFVQSINSRPHLGACDADTEGNWQWLDGSSLTYVSWSAGEPNNMNDEDCLELAYTGGYWNDIWCSSNPYTAGYVCEFE